MNLDLLDTYEGKESEASARKAGSIAVGGGPGRMEMLQTTLAREPTKHKKNRYLVRGDYLIFLPKF